MKDLTFDFLLITHMFEKGRPSVQHGLVLHPVIVEEEERLLAFFF